MSFLGSIAAPLRRIIAQCAADTSLPVLLPCAGNFTIGAALRSGGYRGKITGCDITLHTSALGAYLAGQPLPAAEKEDCPEHLKGFLDCSDPARLAASVCLMIDLRQVWQNKNAWHRRVLANYRRGWDRLMAKTLEKLVAYKSHLGQGGFSYEARDVFEFLASRGPDHAVFIYPPTYGSGGYVRQERMLKAACAWEAPAWRETNFDDPELFEALTSFRQWMIVMDRHAPEVERFLGEPVAVVHSGRKGVLRVHAGHAKKAIVTRSYMASRSPGPIFPSAQRLTGREQPGILLLAHEETVRLNELFMAARVDYILNSIILSAAFCLDKKIIGKADFKLSKAQWALPEKGAQIYQQSDLAVPSSVEPRLSKLVLLLIQSHELKRLLAEKKPEDWRFAITTAFSSHPVSMKYRGVYKLHKRLPGENGGHRLNYYGELGRWTMAEAYANWLKKFHK